MCHNCKSDFCSGCFSKHEPPEYLTENERQRNGWNDRVSKDEEDRLRKIARDATDKNEGWKPFGFGKKR
jgi:hypothetical protein